MLSLTFFIKKKLYGVENEVRMFVMMLKIRMFVMMHILMLIKCRVSLVYNFDWGTFGNLLPHFCFLKSNAPGIWRTAKALWFQSWGWGGGREAGETWRPPGRWTCLKNPEGSILFIWPSEPSSLAFLSDHLALRGFQPFMISHPSTNQA